jgi:nucleoside-diphosphate-sugar epimerase
MRKILITGGAGFIGYNISRILAEDDENDVHIIDDLSKEEMDDEFKSLIERNNVTFYKMDLTDLSTYSKIDPEYDQIYHLAAIVGVKKVTENPSMTIRINSLSTIYLLEYIKEMVGAPKILFASSCENYAGSIKNCNVKIPTPEAIPLCIEDVYNPRWSYAVTKILGEIACLNYSKQYGFDTTIVRYHNIYGPRMGTQHVIPEFILKLKKDPTKLEMFGGNQCRTFCYVTDAAKMTINLMNNKISNDKVLNIGNDFECIKISSLAKKLSQIMQISPEFFEKGAPLGSTEKRIPDLNQIKKLNSYISEVSLSNGLANTFEWYDENYRKGDK